MTTATFRPEGLRAMEFSFSDPIADVSIGGVNVGEAQIEPLLRSSTLLALRELPAVRVGAKRHLKLPWKKTPILPRSRRC